MDTVADIILILSVIGLIVGLIKPSIFHKLTNNSKHPKRKIGLVFGIGIIVGLILLAAFAPAAPVKKAADKTTADNKKPITSSQPATPVSSKTPLRQDLAFQGDAAYCDGIYKDNGNGTTTWSLDVKKPGELITHLSDNGSGLYRHDVQITSAPNYYAYTAPVAIKNVSEINGLLYVGGKSYPCNIQPQQQPQQAY